jgi:hypothetical protein
MLQTGRPTIKTDAQYQLMNAKSAVYDYHHAFRSSGIFNEILAVYVNCIDANLEEMDHDLGDYEFEEEPDSDVEQPIASTVPFEVTNPQYHRQQLGKQSLKQKIAYLSLFVLKTIYNDEFESAIKQSQVDNSMCHALDGMAVGSSQSKLSDLADIFQKMNYTK